MNAQTINELVKVDRRWDIDWLRILVVLMLVPYHTARVFDHDPFYVKNDQLTNALTYWFVRVGDAFAMELLFLLAGASAWFALRRRSGGQYAKERFKRLLIPFIFGLLVLAPPNAYYAKRIHSDYAGSYLEFYPDFFEVGPNGVLDFTGGFTMAHLWFILFLFVFSLVALPIFLFLRRESGARLTSGLARFFAVPGAIFLLALPILAIEWLLDSNPDLIAIIGIVFYFMFVIYGYLFMTDARFWEAIDRHKMVALIVGPVLYVVLGVVQEFAVIPHWFGVVYHRSLFPWLAIIAVLGYGKKYLNAAPKRSLSAGVFMYFGEGSYAYYLLHQTVLVVIAFCVVQWVPSTELGAGAGIAIKYVLIAVATFVGTIIAYELLVRRISVSRFLFGMRPKRKPQEAPAERSREAVA